MQLLPSLRNPHDNVLASYKYQIVGSEWYHIQLREPNVIESIKLPLQHDEVVGFRYPAPLLH